MGSGPEVRAKNASREGQKTLADYGVGHRIEERSATIGRLSVSLITQVLLRGLQPYAPYGARILCGVTQPGLAPWVASCSMNASPRKGAKERSSRPESSEKRNTKQDVAGSQACCPRRVAWPV
jgi:hypothetical protein